MVGEKLSRFDQSTLVTKFDPSGNDYDTQTALDAGATPDQKGHGQSLDPRTGMVLKGRNHETWDLMVDEETKLGNSIINADDGRYYSVKNNKYTSSSPVTDSDLDDTKENFAERAKRDYDFSIENNVEFGFGDAVRHEWGSFEAVRKKIPFVGGLYSVFENAEMIATANRLTENDYEQAYWEEFGLIQHLGPFEVDERLGTKEEFAERFKQQDRDAIAAHLKYITSDKTVMAKITAGVSALPTWFIEFAATGGLASLGDDIAVKAGEKILGQYAKTAAGKIAIRAAGVSVGGITRTIGLGHKVMEGTTRRQLDVVLGLAEKEGWAMSALISWGDIAIESISEATGDELTKGAGFLLSKTKFGSKVASALGKSWITVTGGTKGEFIRKLASKGGYSNILAEIGEERIGTILRAITDVDDFGAGKDATMIERLQAGIIQDWENIGVEIGVLAVPFAGQAAIGGIANFGKREDFFTDEFDQTVEPEPLPEESTQKPASEADVVAPDATEDAETKKEDAEPTEPAKEKVEKEPGDVIEKKEPVAEEIVAIKDGNTDKDMDTVANTLITGKGDAQSTSARQDNLQADREALGLDGIASTGRKGWQKSLQDAQDQMIPDNAPRIAAEINDTPRPLNDVETAGLVIKGARLKNEHKSLMDKITETEDPAEIASLNTQLARVEKEFDVISSALYKSGSEKGRALAAQKLTINQDFDLLSLKNRAKARKGKPLTAKETKKIEQLAKDLKLISAQNKLLQKKVDTLTAKTVIKRGGIKRYSNMSRQQIDLELDSLVSRTQQLLEEGCHN